MNGNGIALKSLLQSNALEVPFFQRPYVLLVMLRKVIKFPLAYT